MAATRSSGGQFVCAHPAVLRLRNTEVWPAVMALLLEMRWDLHLSSGVVLWTLLVGYLETTGFHLVVAMGH